MKYQIQVYELDSPMRKKTWWLRDFSRDYLESVFIDRSYGKDIENISIVIILIRHIPGYEAWDKPRRPKYIEHYESVSYITGEPVRWEWNKRFVIEIRFNNDVYDEFLKADDEQSKRIIARETLKALELLDKVPKRLKDFDKERFRTDVANYYRSQGWID
ncbi:MAG: hypothetical protein IJ687_02010 [Bacteroidales bacterium]|nr:hypothetical protein [Bacteroidales bacterium]